MNATVILVHGIWCPPGLMAPLAWRLRRCGFRVRYFSYPTVNSSPAENAARLNAFAQRIDAPTVHFVAHSLGGLVTVRLFHDFPAQPPGRVVLLGAPLAGSRMAARLAGFAPGRWLLGRSVEQGLLGGGPAWDGARELGMIAGTVGLGLGLLLGGLGAEGDGAVALAETRAAGLRDHVDIRTSHTGLLFSAAAARQICRFLERGRFEHAGPP